MGDAGTAEGQVLLLVGYASSLLDSKSPDAAWPAGQ